MPADETERELTELIDEQRHRDITRRRARERSLRSQAEESATLAGVFLQAFDDDASLSVRTTSDRTHRGVVRSVGRDVVVLGADTGAVVALRMSAVTTIQVEPTLISRAAASGGAGSDTLFSELLADSVVDQPMVTLVMAGDTEAVTGKLRAVGDDVVSVGVGTRVLYVSLSAVSEVSFLAST